MGVSNLIFLLSGSMSLLISIILWGKYLKGYGWGAISWRIIPNYGYFIEQPTGLQKTILKIVAFGFSFMGLGMVLFSLFNHVI